MGSHAFTHSSSDILAFFAGWGEWGCETTNCVVPGYIILPTVYCGPPINVFEWICFFSHTYGTLFCKYIKENTHTMRIGDDVMGRDLNFDIEFLYNQSKINRNKLFWHWGWGLNWNQIISLYSYITNDDERRWTKHVVFHRWVASWVFIGIVCIVFRDIKYVLTTHVIEREEGTTQLLGEFHQQQHHVHRA